MLNHVRQLHAQILMIIISNFCFNLNIARFFFQKYTLTLMQLISKRPLWTASSDVQGQEIHSKFTRQIGACTEETPHVIVSFSRNQTQI